MRVRSGSGVLEVLDDRDDQPRHDEVAGGDDDHADDGEPNAHQYGRT